MQQGYTRPEIKAQQDIDIEKKKKIPLLHLCFKN